MNNITKKQINFASKITDYQYKKSSEILNEIGGDVIKNNLQFLSNYQLIIYVKCKLIIKLYELYHFINLDWIITDEELKQIFPNNVIDI